MRFLVAEGDLVWSMPVSAWLLAFLAAALGAVALGGAPDRHFGFGEALGLFLVMAACVLYLQ